MATSDGIGRADLLALAVMQIGQVTALPEGCGIPTSSCLLRPCEMCPNVLCNVAFEGVYCVIGIAGRIRGEEGMDTAGTAVPMAC